MSGIERALLTLFGVGYSPILPGTLGSIVAVLLLLCLEAVLPEALPLRIAAVALVFGGVLAWSARVIKKVCRKKFEDFQWIVIDEFLGMYIALLPVFFLPDYGIVFVLCSFLFFRLFDMTKIFGIKKIDDRTDWEAIILDDVVAGLYALICVGLIYLLSLVSIL